MSIKYINPNITISNLTEYFEKIPIAGDGNCAIHSIIYAINKYTDIQTYKAYKPTKSNGIRYYDRRLTDLFRNDISEIYGEKIAERQAKLRIATEKNAIQNHKKKIKKFEQRKRIVLMDREWLNNDDIQLYGEKYNLCIGLFQTNPFRFIIMSNINDTDYGFNNCPNVIFLLNRSKQTGTSSLKTDGKALFTPISGIHFEALVPKKGLDIYKDLTMAEITKLNDAYNNPVVENGSPTIIKPKTKAKAEEDEKEYENENENEEDEEDENEEDEEDENENENEEDEEDENAENENAENDNKEVETHPTELFYKKEQIDMLNEFITELKLKYNVELDTKICFYTEIPEVIDNKIVLNTLVIKEVIRKTPIKKTTTDIEPIQPLQTLTDVDNELLKDFPAYSQTTINIDMKNFYLNDQYGFNDTVHNLLEDLYNEEEEEKDSCDKSSSDFVMLRHQKIVQKYLNSYTPYRGLLLYHGLGSGKTCSSISMIEGMKHDKKIYIMTPASLQQNYRTQLQFCGDRIFKTNNNWTRLKATDDNKDSIFQLFKDYLYLDKDKDAMTKYIDKYHCVWVINSSGISFNKLESKDKLQVNELITQLISMKYRFINYNGVNKKSWERIRANTNPFHNSVVIIDEAHNFIGKVFNKISTDKTSVSTNMYDNLMDAQNCKIVLLSGTPYINSPAELGVMFNLISGYTVQYEFLLNGKYNKDKIKQHLAEIEKYNIVDYKLNKVSIIRNPFGFITTETGEVKYEKSVQFKNDNYVSNITKIINDIEGLSVENVNIHKYKKMPESEKDFNNLFVKQEGDIKLIDNKDFFQTRIAGLISYLGDKTSLMPKLLEHIVEYIPMSSHQKREYDKYKEKESTKKTDSKSEGSYKVFTRAACNFVFDDKIVRPFPKLMNKITSEKDFDYADKNERIKQDDSLDEDGEHIVEDTTYDTNIKQFIIQVIKNRDTLFNNELTKLAIFERKTTEPDTGLQKYSPKFEKILNNILNNIDKCQLLYTSFRRIEGIEMMSLLLKYQGFQQLEIKQNGSIYKVELHGLPGYTYDKLRVFTLYTGTEDKVVKEYIRNIYNSDFNKLPSYMTTTLKTLYGVEELNNTRGDIINLLMITASGAEGIDLQNTRIVHITEPYWHYVRIEQVIGRARRICSHNRLPIEDQNVQVYIYISELNDEKKAKPDISTDEFLLKIMNDKHRLSESFLNTLKESAIDCVSSKNKCFKFPNKEKGKKVYELDYKKEPQQKQKRNERFMNYYISVDGVNISVLYKDTIPPEAYIKEDKILVTQTILPGNKIFYKGNKYKMLPIIK